MASSQNYIVDHCMVCGLGVGNEAVAKEINDQKTAIKWQPKWTTHLSLFPKEWLEWKNSLQLDQTLTEEQQQVIAFIKYWITQSPILEEVLKSPSTFAILWSTTKGGIGSSMFNLSEFLKPISRYFGWNQLQQAIVSTACVSGVLAIQEADLWLKRNPDLSSIIVIGLDFMSPFIVEGFQSFKALSSQVTLPFHISRSGLNLGEAMAGVIVARTATKSSRTAILGIGSSNDANHLSGPSRTGEELGRAIELCSIVSHTIDFVLLHGTGTVYNDEMEYNALRTQGVEKIPFWAPKYYIGHTLGASGILEVALTIQLLISGINLSHPYFENENELIHELKPYILYPHQESYTFLKTAAGFGGCNAAILLQWFKGV